LIAQNARVGYRLKKHVATIQRVPAIPAPGKEVVADTAGDNAPDPGGAADF
jgi:hypothetical protein